MRKCYACGIEKELVDFAKDKSKPRGRSYKCKKCDNKYRSNRDKEGLNKYRSSERYLQWSREYRSKRNSSEQYRQYQRDYYASHRKSTKPYKSYTGVRTANTQYKRHYRRLRDHLKRGRGDKSITVRLWFEMLETCSYECMNPACSNTSDLTLDHVIPLSHPQGTHTAKNVQILCRSCNCIKGTSTIDYRPTNWPWM